MTVKYIRINESGEQAACDKKDATHVQIPQEIYEALLEGNFGFIKTKIDLVKSMRAIIKEMSALSSETNERYNEYRDIIMDRSEDFFTNIQNMRYDNYKPDFSF